MTAQITMYTVSTSAAAVISSGSQTGNPTTASTIHAALCPRFSPRSRSVLTRCFTMVLSGSDASISCMISSMLPSAATASSSLMPSSTRSSTHSA